MTSKPPVRVAVLDDYQDVAASLADWTSLAPGAEVQFFHDTIADLEALVERLAPFPVIVIMRERTPFPRALFERLPNLKLLVTTGKRNAAIDLEAATAHGVLVCGTDTLTHPTVELAWALILSLARHVSQESAALRAGRWQTTLGAGLRGRTLGVVGLGRLGAEVARIGQAFGMEVIAWSPNLTLERAAEVGVVRVVKAELFASADVISVHMVLSPRSAGLVGAADIAEMKPTAVLVNTSRAGLIDEAALVAALREKRIGGAGIDVWPKEPLSPDHPLLAFDTVVATPHLGYVTEENYRTMYSEAVEAVAGWLSGAPVRPLNQPVG